MKRIDNSLRRTIYYHYGWVAFRNHTPDSWTFRNVFDGAALVVGDVPLRRLRKCFSCVIKYFKGRDTTATRWLKSRIVNL